MASKTTRGGNRHEFRNTTPGLLPAKAQAFLAAIAEDDWLVPEVNGVHWRWYAAGRPPRRLDISETTAIDHLVDTGHLKFSTDGECWVLK